ncbi:MULTISPECIES: methylmalonyl-CoA epimerase [Tepidanaerobacter]|uniref:Methylmalonyl-CoA/ethylmalonyl-CoA epimerase n=1 Tax=Tepidanaerobacter syntrophicus TaxID=224999 RepID=A0A0U9HJS1_9FIRM|nr:MULTISPECIES: methylmalonyl-CoA epimerase [Tepidanaerobacter]GAQ26180.1 methylmalonyl-CoA/ethylmalonyl-CoA epimerase [Tepidanaerobacter syntrophicus]GLI19168.1 methylmalonyl-CoA epimerase [Tepidanaerobacter syntrophicus]GLI50200.1 methylmalonyl-CoA epimerase [Tepidanaerobacter syntrophicus]HHV83606.1 methylmalonyl-CoA epimerase [Tepidanaerobacter syntrophicus]
MIEKIDHIGIAVSNIQDAAKFYTEALGLKVSEIETVEEQKVKTVGILLGDTRIELLEPLGAEGPIAKFIEKRGEGIQHIALKVDDIKAQLDDLKQKGIRLIDEEPKMGAGGAKIAFIHPKSTNGILIELCER